MTPSEFHEIFSSFDVRGIPGYPNKIPFELKELKECVLQIHRDVHQASQFLSSFMDFMTNHKFIEEDVLMNIFAISLQGNAKKWLRVPCPPRETVFSSPFPGYLIQDGSAKHLDPSYRSLWIKDLGPSLLESNWASAEIVQILLL